MQPYELKKYIESLVQSYFQAANVIWSSEVSTKPRLPAVMLRLSNMRMGTFAVEAFLDGEIVWQYPSSAILEINVFTAGVAVPGTIGMDNTALADINEFCKYIGSPEMTDVLAMNDLAFTVNGPINDIPKLLGTTDYEYRAMVEYLIDFTQTVSGIYSLNRPSSELSWNQETSEWVPPAAPDKEHWKPTTSGGGTYELTHAEQQSIETIDISENADEMEE